MTQRFPGSNDQCGDGSGSVIDIQQVREKRTREKKRRAERIFFKNLLSVYSVTDSQKLIPIELIEVSEDGCSFQVEHQSENPWPKQSDEIPIRFYFSSDTYLEVAVKIANSSPSIDQSVRMVRFGCLIDQSLRSYPAYQQFVRFLRMYAEHSCQEVGSQSGFY
jgi:hypothetical protein